MRCGRCWSTGVGFRPEVKVLGIDPRRRRPAVWFLRIPVGRLGHDGAWSVTVECVERAQRWRQDVASQRRSPTISAPCQNSVIGCSIRSYALDAALDAVWALEGERRTTGPALAARCQGPYTCVTGDTAFRICCHQCTPNRKPD